MNLSFIQWKGDHKLRPALRAICSGHSPSVDPNHGFNKG
jgi:hypothetical protein